MALLLPMGTSYVTALTESGSTESPFQRTVQWVRSHGGNGLVNTVERWYYTTIAAPKKGGRPDKLEAIGVRDQATPRQTTATTAPLRALSTPPPTTPVPTPAPVPESGEGVWVPSGRLVDGQPAIYTTWVRPDSVRTSYIVTLMWMDPKLLKFTYVPGTKQPGGGPNPWGSMIPVEERGSLVAAFNSGFQMVHARGGANVAGEEVVPMRDGAATLVVKSDGSADVGMWGRDFQMSPDIAAARQNLELLLDNYQLNPELRENDTSAFGATVGNNVYVWRSGICVLPSGGLVYAAGPAQSVLSLAKTLQAVGCVRGMELDINHDWTTAYLFSSPDPNLPQNVVGEKLHPDMSRDGTRYLEPGVVDFFALFADPTYPTPTTTTTTTTTAPPSKRGR
ncbi:MAG: hypothetical protein FJW95_11365 [Actinobacteria bacterium]|nr:hypothetical protein [Actinomycetota bacterium]